MKNRQKLKLAKKVMFSRGNITWKERNFLIKVANLYGMSNAVTQGLGYNP